MDGSGPGCKCCLDEICDRVDDGWMARELGVDVVWMKFVTELTMDGWLEAWMSMWERRTK